MNFNLILEGKNEFYTNLNNKIYSILVVKDKIQIKFMNKIFKEFNNGNTIIGLDFEFKKVTKENKEIALMQINLENNTKNAFIFILYPPKLNNKSLIELLCNEQIIKVIHGGESLDIPYLFNSLLKSKSKIKKFLSNTYDTKFLCEFYHYQNKINAKCNIYNLLEEFKIIGKKNINYLKKLEDKIGEIYLIKFNINSLSEELINYALYDVIYLPELIKKFISIENTNIIKNITAIIYYNKKINNKKLIDFSENINSLNNNFIELDNENFNLVDIFYYFYYYKFNNIFIELSNITYFKNFIELIIKYCIYKNTLENYKVFSSNNKINDNKLDYNIDKLLINKKQIIELFNKIFNDISSKLF
jgi:hypothetical protein